MKLGAFNTLFYDRDFEPALEALKSYGCDAVEIGCGGFITKRHINPADIIEDDGACRKLAKTVEKYGLEISALSVHGNMLHPKKDFSASHIKDFQEAVKLASKIGVKRVVTFAGCPGTSDHDEHPSWITCPWPDYFTEALTWQWEKKIIPFWKEQAALLKRHEVDVCLEMHPGDSVYCPEKLLTLREAAGESICCNFDPSHMFWQGIDPIAAIKELKDCIKHVHAKDVKQDKLNIQVNGVMDNKPYLQTDKRSWIFRTVGYGNDYSFWKDFVSALRIIGYDYVLSIEHEDSLMSGEEGLEKAARFLKDVMIHKPTGAMWWD